MVENLCEQQVNDLLSVCLLDWHRLSVLRDQAIHDQDFCKSRSQLDHALDIHAHPIKQMKIDRNPRK